MILLGQAESLPGGWAPSVEQIAGQAWRPRSSRSSRSRGPGKRRRHWLGDSSRAEIYRRLELALSAPRQAGGTK